MLMCERKIDEEQRLRDKWEKSKGKYKADYTKV